MPVYTCNGCELQFADSDSQRQHMKSEWHRYNLKRKVAQLPPISEDVFNSKVQALSQQNQPEDVEKGKQKQPTKKEIRRREKEALLERKKALLDIAYENAAKSRGQLESKNNESYDNSPDPESPVEEPSAEKLMQEKISNRVDIPVEECLFCGKKFSDLDSNTEHMLKSHGFFIPEQKYLIDKPGLVKYISEKIGLGNICIVCNYQGRSLEAVRQHMLAKRHCRIPYEEEDEKLEISDFYDFTASYGGDVISAGHGNDEDWEDVETDEDVDEYEDQELTQEAIYHDGVELHLPTGVKVGHRSLQKYYKQNLKPESELTEGQGTVMAAETRNSLKPYDKKKVQLQKGSWKQEVRNKKQHDKKGAKHKNFQPHYRDQLLQ